MALSSAPVETSVLSKAIGEHQHSGENEYYQHHAEQG